MITLFPIYTSATIRFSLPETEHVRVEVLDLLGRSVTTLFDDLLQAGEHRIGFDPQNLGGGVYYLWMEEGRFRATRKMLYLNAAPIRIPK